MIHCEGSAFEEHDFCYDIAKSQLTGVALTALCAVPIAGSQHLKKSCPYLCEGACPVACTDVDTNTPQWNVDDCNKCESDTANNLKAYDDKLAEIRAVLAASKTELLASYDCQGANLELCGRRLDALNMQANDARTQAKTDYERRKQLIFGECWYV